MKLYELSQELKNWEERLEENGGEVSPAELDELSSIETSIEEKIINIVKLVKNNEANIYAIKEEKKRLDALQKTLERQNESLKSYMKQNMEVTGKTKIESSLFTVSIRRTTPKLLLDESLIMKQEKFLKTKVEISKTAIREALKEGEDVEGAILEEQRILYIR